MTHPAFLPLVVMWHGMMTAMMAPVAWPWLRAYARMATIDAEHADHAEGTDHAETTKSFLRVLQFRSASGFATGYLAVWLGYSVAAAALQSWLFGANLAASVGLAAVVLALAGVYQLVPAKRACLTHCRNPLTYFLTQWKSGPGGAFRLGAAHGAYCVGCCWALMLTALATGLMNVWWMALLAVVAFVEQAVPFGDRLRIPLGLGLIGAGVWRWLV